MRNLSFAALSAAFMAFCVPGVYAAGNYSINGSSYVQISQQRVDQTHWYFTYSASLLNTGPAVAGVTATLTSLAPGVQLVPGQSILHFSPVAAGTPQSPSQTLSSNTFTILVDRTQAFSFNNLSWSFDSPFANPGPNQFVAVDSTVTLNGSGSTNPTGIGSLTYSWAFSSVPSGSHASLNNAGSMTSTFQVDLPGTYIITLTVSNGTTSDSNNITVSTVNSPPVANAGPNQTVTVGSTVILDGSKSSDVDGNTITYFWSFVSIPGSSNAVLQNARSASASFVADKAGTYIVGLVVNDGTVNSQMATVAITTGNTPPVAVATAQPSRTNLNQLVQLSGAGSTDVDSNPLTYQWSLNLTQAPGSKAVITNPTSVNASFIADVPGTYVAQLIVFDGITPSQPTTVTVTTNAVLAPSANAGATQKININNKVQLTGTGTDPQSLPLTYTWSMLSKPPGSTATLSATNISNPTFVPDIPGAYTLQLVVYNGYLFSSTLDPNSIVTITSSAVLPVAVPKANPTSPQIGTTVTLDSSQSTDPNGDPLTGYTWALLTVPPGSQSQTTLQNAGTATATFVPDLAGTYVAQLIVKDAFASSLPQTVSIVASASSITFSTSPLNLTLSPATITVTIVPPAGNTAVTVNLLGYATNEIQLSPATLTIPANSSTAQLTITPLSTGQTTINAQASGYPSGSETVTVSSPTISLSLSNSATSVGLTHSISGTITLSAPAPSPNGTTVVLSNDASSTGSVSFTPTMNITIPAGNTTGSFTITGSTLGAVVIDATASKYTSGTYSISVVTLGSISIPSGQSVPAGQTGPLTVQLSSAAPVDGATINLMSGDTTILTVAPASVPILAGAKTPDSSVAPQITGLKIGQVTITATAGGYTQATATVNATATLSFSTQAVSVGAGGVQNLNLLLSAPAPASGLTVTLTGDKSGVATFPASVSFTGGQTSIPVQITGSTQGVVNISASTTNPSVITTGATVAVTVSSTVTLTCPATTTGEVGVQFSTGPLNVALGTAPYTFSIASGALPAGLSMNSSTGAISGTPQATGSFTVQVKDSNGTAATTTCPFTINAAPSITCSNVTSGEVTVAFNSPALIVSGGTSPFTFSLASGTLPAGLSLNSTSGAISGTPQAAGSFTVQLKDSLGAIATTTCPITIAPVPAMTCPTTTTGEVGLAFNSGAPNVTGGTTPYTFSTGGTLPAGLSLNTSTGAVTGTPQAAGSFTIQVKDANQVAATASCPITIAPTLTLTCPSSTTGEVNLAFSSAAITTNGGVAPITFSLAAGSTLPGGLSLNSATGAITGTPQAAGTFAVQGKDSLGATSTSNCNFSIATAPTMTCPANTAGEVNAAFNSGAPNVTGGTTPYTFSTTGTVPAGLSLNTSTGAITGTPSAAGSFTLQVKDANGVSAATTCPITIANGPVVACPTTGTTGEVGIAFSSAAPTVTNGTAPFTFSVATGTLPAGLALNSSTGAITGTPQAAGTFTIQVKDSVGATGAPNCSYSIAAAPTVTCSGTTTGEVGIAFSSAAPVVSGGVPPYTFSASGTLPAGLTLNSSTGAIAGTPSVSGSFSLQVKDSLGGTGAPTCPITIASAPTATCPTTGTTGEVGVAFSSSPITMSGGTGTFTFSVGTGTLPGGLTLNSANGAITGTPQAAGTFTIQAKDSLGATATPTCTYSIAQGLSVTCPGSTTGVVNVAFSSPAITVTGGTMPYTFSVQAGGTLPAGLSLNTATGAVTGTPQAAGTFNVQVKDALGATGSACAFNIGTALTLTCPSTLNGEVGVAFNSTATVSGGTAPYTFSVNGTLPAGLSLNPSTGAITGTPQAAGSFTLQVKDSTNTVAGTTCAFTIVSGPTETCPSTPNGEVGVPFSSAGINVTGGVGPYSFSVGGTLPAGLSLNTSTGAVTGTPQTAGSFTVQAKDANNVVAPPACPITIAATLTATCPTTTTGEAMIAFNSGAITTSGGVGPFTYSVSAGTMPAGLTLNASTGAISGTPQAAGTFSVQVKDSLNVIATPVCSFSIVGGPSLTCPTTTSGEQGAAFSTPAMTVTGGVSPYTFSVVTAGSLPAGLSLNASTGAISGTPTASGAFTVQVKDANGVTAATTCPITIGSAPALTCPSTLAGFTGVAFNSPAMTVTGGTAPYTFSSTPATLPAGLTLNTATGAITGTPTATGTFTVQVKDSLNVTASTTCTFNMTVQALSIATTSLTNAVAGMAYNFTMTASGGKPPYQWAGVNVPSWMTVGPTGVLGGTPRSATTYTNLVFSVTDQNGTVFQNANPFQLVVGISNLQFTTPAQLPIAPTVPPTLYTQQIVVTGGNPPYTWTPSNFPTTLDPNTGKPWLVFDATGIACQTNVPTVCGTPPVAAIGTNNFTLSVSDNSNTIITQTFTIPVTQQNTVGTLTLTGGPGGTNSFNVGNGLEVPFTITLSPTPITDIMLTVQSGTPGAILIGDQVDAGSSSVTVKIPANTTSLAFYAQSVSASTLPSSPITITASVAGGAYNSGTANVTVANSAFVLSTQAGGIGGAFATFQGTPNTVTIGAARLDGSGNFVEEEPLAGGTTVVVFLNAVPSAAGNLSAPFITFNAGDSDHTFTFTGSSSFTGGASITETQPTNFITPAVGNSLSVTVSQSGIIAPSGLTIGKNLQISTSIAFNGTATQDILVNLSTQSSSLMFSATETGPGASTLQVKIPQGFTSSKTFWIRGYASSGTPTFQAQTDAFGTLPAIQVVLGQTALVIQVPGGSFDSTFGMPANSPSDATLTVFPALLTGPGQFTLQEVAADQTITSTVSSSNTGAATMSGPACSPVNSATACITIPGAGQSATATVHAGASGSSTLTTAGSGASASAGYVSETAGVTITNCKISVNNGLVVGQFLESPANQAVAIMSCPAGTNGVTVTVTSNSPSTLLLAVNPGDVGSTSINVNVASGSSLAAFYVYSMASSGTGTYSVSAPGYTANGLLPNGTDLVTFAPSGIIIQAPNSPALVSINTTANGGPQTLAVYSYQLSTDGQNTITQLEAINGSVAGGKVTVNLDNLPAGFGTLSAGSINLTPGTSSGTVTFTPSADGSTSVSIHAQPSGMVTPFYGGGFRNTPTSQVGISIVN